MPQKWRTMLGVSLGALCPPIGVSTISIGLPVIAAALHQPVTSAEWVIVVYTLVITSLLMTFGRLGDLISTKLLYVVGFIVFTLGALASGLSPSFGWLLASRAVQGVGGAMMFSVAAAIVTRAFPPSERGLALGINAVFIYAGLTVGPLLGAFVLVTWSWRGLFLINVHAATSGSVRYRRCPHRFTRPVVPAARFEPGSNLGIIIARNDWTAARERRAHHRLRPMGAARRGANGRPLDVQ